MRSQDTCLIGLGANLGNREDNLNNAWRQIGTLPLTYTLRLSSFYETHPLGGPANQPMYLNAAGIIGTKLAPLQLLKYLNKIELELHRERKIHWGPRTIDLDILLFGDIVLQTDELTIPHPRMESRQFVLMPANEIAPDMIHPLKQLTIAQLWTRLKWSPKSE